LAAHSPHLRSADIPAYLDTVSSVSSRAFAWQDGRFERFR